MSILDMPNEKKRKTFFSSCSTKHTMSNEYGKKIELRVDESLILDCCD